MSRLEIVSIEEAMAKTASGKRAKIIHEYLGYIRQLESGQAGMLPATEDESAIAIRRRLNQAAKAAGVELRYQAIGRRCLLLDPRTQKRASSQVTYVGPITSPAPHIPGHMRTFPLAEVIRFSPIPNLRLQTPFLSRARDTLGTERCFPLRGDSRNIP